MSQFEKESWHLSKSVPVTLILTLFVQAAIIVWTVSTMSNNIDRNKSDIIRLDTRITSVERIVQEQAVTMARMDANIQAIREYIEQMLRQQSNSK